MLTHLVGITVDEELASSLFVLYIEKGEISNLSAYNFYCRIVGVESQEPISGETLLTEGLGSRA